MARLGEIEKIVRPQKKDDSYRPRVLVVDDDPSSLSKIMQILDEGGFWPEGAEGSFKARGVFRKGKFDVVVTEVVMEDMSGIDLLRFVRGQDQFIPVICISKVHSFENSVEMVRGGASDFLSKPVEPRKLIGAVTQACIKHQYILEKEQIVAGSDKWTRELLALRQLGEASREGILQTLFRRAIQAVADTLQVESASLMLIEGEILRVVEAIGLPPEIVGQATGRLGKGISGHVAQTGEAILINDISTHEKFGPSSYKKQYSTESALCVPLLRGDRVLGVMNANNKMSGETFTESDRDLLVTMAAQVALSIDNARLFSDLKKKAEDLRKAHEELVRLDRDKTELILNISHELKTPLTSIIGFASLIPTLELGGETDSLMDCVSHLENSASHLNYLVERILELFRLEAGRVSLRLEACPAREAVDAALQELGNVMKDRRIIWDYSCGSQNLVSCDSRLFTRALELILENAVKFSLPESPIEVGISYYEQFPKVPAYALSKESPFPSDNEGGWVRITVRDHGQGMKEKDIPRIFEKFKQLGNIMTEKPAGIGLGLSIARAIMERHSGAVWADLVPEGGTRLHLLLPAV